jgi:hypothetical protein
MLNLKTEAQSRRHGGWPLTLKDWGQERRFLPLGAFGNLRDLNLCHSNERRCGNTTLVIPSDQFVAY